MTGEEWARVRRAFDELVSLPPGDARIAAALRLEPESVRREVDRLLRYADASTAVVDRRAVDLLEDDVEADAPPVAGRFRIVRRLGSGGMGVVYEARDEQSGSTVALKQLRRVTPQSLDLFKREFRALSRIHHPNLAMLYELFAEERSWFFTMEMVDGCSLLDHVAARSSSQTPGDRVRLIRNLLPGLVDAVDALHAHGKLHRDLKPTNVMVSAAGRVVVLDFGLVADLAPGGSAGGLVHGGTPAYMSPEQLRGDTLTVASDWYAVGVMLFQALTGTLPAGNADRHSTELAWAKESDGDGAVRDLLDLCAALLKLQPADRPSPAEIRQRAGIARSHSPRIAVTPADLSPLLGRDAEVAMLTAAADDAACGRTVLVTIDGQPGVGKSGLLRTFSSHLAASRWTVIDARCYERESLTLNVFDSLMDGISRHLAGLAADEREQLLPADVAAMTQMFPVLTWLRGTAAPAPPLDKAQQRRAAVAALRDLLTRLSAAGPLALVVDDVQWCDVDSALMLLDLLRRGTAPHALFVLAYRGSEYRSNAGLDLLLGELVADGQSDRRHLALEPLSPGGALALASRLVGPAEKATAEAIARESHGNPYFIQELAAHTAMLPGNRAGGSLDGLTLPAVITARLQLLPDPARRVLELVAVSGRPVRSVDAIEAAGLVDRTPAWLAILLTRNFVRSSVAAADYVEPYHDRLRETILSTLPADQLRARHAALAETLERSGSAEAEALAEHLAAAGHGGRAAGYYAIAAANAAAALGFHAAADLYGRALALTAPDAPERLPWLRARADALANAGRAREAADDFHEAAADEGCAGAVALSRAAYHYAASGHIEQARTAFRGAIARLDIRIPLDARPAIAALLVVRASLAIRGLRFRERPADAIPAQQLAAIDMCWFVGTGLGLVDLMTGAVFTSHALSLALASGDAFRIARGLTWEAAIAASQSRRGKRRAERLLTICGTLADRLGDPYTQAMLQLTTGQVQFSHGRWTAAIERFARARETFTSRCTGVAFELATLYGFHLQALAYRGDYTQLRREAPELLDLARGSGDGYLETFVAGAIMPMLLLADDDPAAARRAVSDALGRWTNPGYHLQNALIDQVRIAIELYDGRPDVAANVVQSIWPQLRRSNLLFNQNLRAKMLEMRARVMVARAIAVNEPRRHLAAARAIRALEREDEPCFAGSVLSLRSAIAHARGNRRHALTLMDNACTAFDHSEMGDYAAAAATTAARWAASDTDADRRRDGAHLAWYAREGVRNPERWTYMRIPARTR